MKMKRDYVAPVMTHVQVELEQGFMKASIFDGKEAGASVNAHSQDYSELNGDAFGGSNDAGIEWDTTGGI